MAEPNHSAAAADPVVQSAPPAIAQTPHETSQAQTAPDVATAQTTGPDEQIQSSQAHDEQAQTQAQTAPDAPAATDVEMEIDTNQANTQTALPTGDAQKADATNGEPPSASAAPLLDEFGREIDQSRARSPSPDAADAERRKQR